MYIAVPASADRPKTMLHSMTAYGRSAQTTGSSGVQCEIRSVNHRYLDISIRLPDTLGGAESVIRERLAASLHRGKVEAIFRDEQNPSSAGLLTVNDALLLELAEAAGKVAALTKAACVVDSVALLKWPGVLVSGELQSVQVQQIDTAFDQALQDFLATREREGEQIAALLVQRSNALSAIVAQLREQRPVVLERQRERLVRRLSTLHIEHDGARLEQELVYAAQRLDIYEELDRLDVHTTELGLVLQRSEPVGRCLDFLMQEFSSEANTVSSKSSDARTTALAVEMKVLIEQMREQIQNVE